MKGRHRTLLLVLGGLCLGRILSAAVDRWTPIGPFGGDVRAIAISPSHPEILYAGTLFGGVFRSDDSGLSWRPVNGGLTDFDVFCLAIDPRTPNVVYAGSSHGGIFKTSDGGNSWSPRNEGVGTAAASCGVSAIAVDPASPETVYAGVCGNGVYKSVNGGSTWTPPDPTEIFVGGGSIAVDPSRPQILYSSSFHSISRSVDAGDTWESLTGFLGGSTLAIDPTSPNKIYAGGDDFTIARSEDGGANWVFTQPDSGSGSVQALAIDPRVPSTIYAATSPHLGPGGIFRSTDSGGTWTSVEGVQPGTFRALAVSRGANARLYAGALAQGVLSSETGLDWRERNTGLNAVPVTGVAVDPSDPSLLYVSRGDLGVSVSRDGGLTWRAANDGLPAFDFHAVATDPVDSGVAYAGSVWAGLFRSGDRGETWTRLLRGAPQLGVISLATTASPPAIYAGTAGLGVFRSSDGDFWSASSTPVGVGSAPSFAFDPSAPGTVYTPTFFTPTVCPGFCPPIPGEIARSTDGGDHWESLPRLENAVAVAVDPAASAVLYAGIRDEVGVFVTENAGGRWIRRTAGLEGASITALATSVGIPAVVYAGSVEDGIFVSSDRGLTWDPLSTGLVDLRIRLLTRSPDGRTLLAGTQGGGVYTLEIEAPGCSAGEAPCRRAPILVGPRGAVDLSESSGLLSDARRQASRQESRPMSLEPRK